MTNNPVGIFDSGVGGLSVWREIDRLLPNESIIYYADNANCPYGEKTQDEVIRYSVAVTRFLIARQCKLIVVACNTATSMAIDQLRTMFDIPFIGIVPAVKPAATNSRTGVIAILATAGTLRSQKFNNTMRDFSGNTEIITVEGGELVDIVERGLQGSQQSADILARYINPLMKKNIDHLVLGCTHFPFLIDDIRKIVGDAVVLDNPASAIAQRTKYILESKNIAASPDNLPTRQFFASGDMQTLQNMVEKEIKVKR
jgi:glutamate racemase